MQDLIRLILAILIFLSGCGNAAPEQSENFSYTYGETVIEMGADAQPVIEKMGEPGSYTEQPSCAFDGMDKTYYYGGFYMTTSPAKNGDRISSLWFADDSVQTEEGIRIGDSREKVEQAYGSDGFNGINAWILKKGDSCLTIVLNDDTVTTVLYEMEME